MNFLLGLILGGIFFWALGRAVMFDQTQEEIKKQYRTNSYFSKEEVFGLREYLRRWFCKRKLW